MGEPTQTSMDGIPPVVSQCTASLGTKDGFLIFWDPDNSVWHICKKTTRGEKFYSTKKCSPSNAETPPENGWKIFNYDDIMKTMSKTFRLLALAAAPQNITLKVYK